MLSADAPQMIAATAKGGRRRTASRIAGWNVVGVPVGNMVRLRGRTAVGLPVGLHRDSESSLSATLPTNTTPHHTHTLTHSRPHHIPHPPRPWMDLITPSLFKVFVAEVSLSGGSHPEMRVGDEVLEINKMRPIDGTGSAQYPYPTRIAQPCLFLCAHVSMVCGPNFPVAVRGFASRMLVAC